MGWLDGWTALVLAGMFEIGFTTFMKISNGFQNLLGTIGFGICAILSFYFLTIAVRQIPLGTAYSVWTGIGAAGTTIIGILYFNDPSGWLRSLLIAILIGAVVGLKLVS